MDQNALLITAIVGVVLGGIGLIGGVLGYVQSTAAVRRSTHARQRAVTAEEEALRARAAAEATLRAAEELAERFRGPAARLQTGPVGTGRSAGAPPSRWDERPVTGPTVTPMAEPTTGSLLLPDTGSTPLQVPVEVRPAAQPVPASAPIPVQREPVAPPFDRRAGEEPDVLRRPAAEPAPTPVLRPEPPQQRLEAPPAPQPEPQAEMRAEAAFAPPEGPEPEREPEPEPSSVAEPAPVRESDADTEPRPASGLESVRESQPEPPEDVTGSTPESVGDGDDAVVPAPDLRFAVQAVQLEAVRPPADAASDPVPRAPEPEPEPEDPQDGRDVTGRVTAGVQSAPTMDWAEVLRTGAIPLPSISRGTYAAPRRRPRPTGQGPARFELRAIGRQRWEAVNVGAEPALEARVVGGGDDPHLVRPLSSRPATVPPGGTLPFSVLRVEGRGASAQVVHVLRGEPVSQDLPLD